MSAIDKDLKGTACNEKRESLGELLPAVQLCGAFYSCLAHCFGFMAH